jgi:acyl-CoA synthetase (AMP-forming)/AMP-acid ligase II/acyl carrier protein
MRWIPIEGEGNNAEGEWQEPAVTGDTLAFLQYTSGSTSVPKGVMLTHRNLLHNSAQLRQSFEYTSESHCVSWLPVYHDMGLIGGVLQPLSGGFPCTLMSPFSFLQRPARWLEAISRYRATISGGPDFAYAFCARRADSEQLALLDLSSWRTAFNGSEPIRAETLDRFAEVFAPCGFRKHAFLACYGLAENTLIVSSSRYSDPPLTKRFQTRELGNRRAIESASEDGDVRELVGCGQSLLDTTVIIVNPETLTRCLPEEIGEVWVSGGSVAQGYWNRDAETAQTFQAFTSDTLEGPFLRTGDLGFLQDGELFVTGRLKDLIIIRGLNHYPQDIELTVERSHPSLRPGCGAAFCVEAKNEERLVVVHEVDRHPADIGEIIGRVRRAVVEEHELQLFAAVLIKPGSLPKTSSGKVQRHVCRAAFLNGTLERIAEWQEPAASKGEFIAAANPLTSSGKIDRKNLPAVGGGRKQSKSGYIQPKEEIEQLIAKMWKQALNVEEVGREDNFFDLGGHSLLLVQVHGQLSQALKRKLPLVKMLEHPTVSSLARFLDQEQIDSLSIKRSQDRAEKLREGFGRQRRNTVKARYKV